MAKTRATQAVEQARLVHSVHSYAYDPEAPAIGMQAAESLGVEPAQVLKTLMASVDGRPVCVLLASDREVSMKKLAAAAGGKSAQMMKPADAERATGYHVGGISPFGQRKSAPTFIDAAALTQDFVYVNGGQRGLQIRLDPAGLVSALKAKVADIAS